MKNIRMVIADDHPIVREGWRSILANHNDIEIVAEADDGDGTLRQVIEHRPNVLVMDMVMPGCCGQKLVERLRQRAPHTAVLVITTRREEHYAISMLRAGARGFASKRLSLEGLVKAVRQVARGEVFISPSLAQRIATAAFGGHPPSTLHEQLSPREHEVLVNLVEGRRVGEIAQRLYLSPKTVSTHKTRILKKLQLDNMSALMRYALDHGLL